MAATFCPLSAAMALIFVVSSPAHLASIASTGFAKPTDLGALGTGWAVPSVVTALADLDMAVAFMAAVTVMAAVRACTAFMRLPTNVSGFLNI